MSPVCGAAVSIPSLFPYPAVLPDFETAAQQTLENPLFNLFYFIAQQTTNIYVHIC